MGGGSGHHLYEKQNGLDAEFQVAKRNGLHEGVRGTNAPWYLLLWASPVAQLVRNLPAMQETWVQFLGREDPLEKGNGYPLQNSCLENSKPARLQSMGLQTVGHY